MNIQLQNDLLILNNALIHFGTPGMKHGQHDPSKRWQRHAVYAKGRPDPNAARRKLATKAGSQKASDTAVGAEWQARMKGTPGEYDTTLLKKREQKRQRNREVSEAILDAALKTADKVSEKVDKAVNDALGAYDKVTAKVRKNEQVVEKAIKKRVHDTVAEWKKDGTVLPIRDLTVSNGGREIARRLLGANMNIPNWMKNTSGIKTKDSPNSVGAGGTLNSTIRSTALFGTVHGLFGVTAPPALIITSLIGPTVVSGATAAISEGRAESYHNNRARYGTVDEKTGFYLKSNTKGKSAVDELADDCKQTNRLGYAVRSTLESQNHIQSIAAMELRQRGYEVITHQDFTEPSPKGKSKLFSAEQNGKRGAENRLMKDFTGSKFTKVKDGMIEGTLAHEPNGSRGAVFFNRDPNRNPSAHATYANPVGTALYYKVNNGKVMFCDPHTGTTFFASPKKQSQLREILNKEATDASFIRLDQANLNIDQLLNEIF